METMITMDDELKKKVKYLRLPGLLSNWENYLHLAAKSNFSHARLLKHIVEEEHKIRKENSRKVRMRAAQIPEKFVMETFPFERQTALNKKKILALYDSFEYMIKNHNVLWIGPPGTGKTGLATAFLIQAIDRGYKGRFILFPELMEKLYKSVADHSEEKVIRTYASYDCLHVDELGYVEVEPVQVGLFFTLMNKRHKKTSTLITSNLGFAQWGTFLKNDHLTAALIDRLTENTHVINMKKCVSLRQRLEPSKKDSPDDK
jgi:DNA replication protein DnaC